MSLSCSQPRFAGRLQRAGSGAAAAVLASIALTACGGGDDAAGPLNAAAAQAADSRTAPQTGNGATDAPAPAATPASTPVAQPAAPAPAPVSQPPAAPAAKTIVDVAASNPAFSSLVAAVQFASNDGDLVRALSSPGALTVFAPTNDAFDALARELTGNASATAAALLVPANKDLVRAVLQYHVLAARVLKADVPLGQPIDPLLAGNDTFVIEARGSALQITDGRLRTAQITATDVLADNGVIHVIDRVILPAETAPSRNVVQIAAGNADFSSLVAALQFASNDGDLVALLSGAGPFTIFAPNNAAFDALARELTGNASATAADLLVPANKALVRSVLQYHVLASRVAAASIRSGQPVEPALGGGSFFKIELGGVRPVIADGRGRTANIVATDIAATNGVIHVIDRVILPAADSIVAVALANPQFSNLVAAVQFASNDDDLVNLLSGPGAFTVFAPTNAAFDALARELTHDPRATAAALLVPANKALVRAVLQYHVLGARVLKAQVPLGQPIDPVLAGNATFTIDAVGSGLRITDARHRFSNIVATDVFASNGVVHAIDTVILPPAH